MEGAATGGCARRRKRSNTMHVVVKLVSKAFQLMLIWGMLAISIWRALELVTGVQDPVVIVRSDFKECAIASGDALLLHRKKAGVTVGDVVLSNVHGPERPSVHRVVGVYNHPAPESAWYLTQGDANYLWLQQHQVIGRVFWCLPNVGRYLDVVILKRHKLVYVAMASVMATTCLSRMKTTVRAHPSATST